ncbi:MAG TPA: hypothetical protein VET90_02615, partial [Candidatus Binatus sp.]|nr:hypothetical protein [Candidatus Binatus sp.]
AALGGSRPRAAAILLALPVVVLIIAWIPIVFERDARLSLSDTVGILGVLALPALLAATLIVAAPSPPAARGR